MKNYRPLLLEELPISLPGLKFQRLRLNRHLPEVEKVAEHSHRFGQILLYLSGRGVVRAGLEAHAISPGAVLWIPPGVRHGFDEQSGRRPLCLVLEFQWNGPAPSKLHLARLPGEGLSQIRQQISALAKQPQPEAEGHRLTSAITILRILDLVFPVVGLLPQRMQKHSPMHHRVEKILRQPGGIELGVAEIAGRAGIGREHLSRSLRRETGHTLRDLRDQARLVVAVRALEHGQAVRDAAMQAGILDQNYFARWFKKLTGCRPSQWTGKQKMPFPGGFENRR
jgi:AraC family transcriptional regulator, transcriptional activator of pobA